MIASSASFPHAQRCKGRNLVAGLAVLLVLVFALAGCSQQRAEPLVQAPPNPPAPAAGDRATSPVQEETATPLVKRAQDGVLEIDWLALMGEADRERFIRGEWEEPSTTEAHPGPEGSFTTNMAQRQIKGFASIPDFDHQRVRVAGYFVPLEHDAAGVPTEILFVPYFGACLHVPPPPASQIIYAKLDRVEPDLSMFNAYWLEGTLIAQTNTKSLAVSGYTMMDAKLRLWE